MGKTSLRELERALADVGHKLGQFLPTKRAEHYSEMTLRDYFAVAALSHPGTHDLENAANTTPADTAEWAYAIADAMLAERKVVQS